MALELGLDVFDIDIKRDKLAKEKNIIELEQTYNGTYPEAEISTVEKWNNLSNFESVPPIRIQRLKRIVNLVDKNSNVLDIGCGWGDIIKLLENKLGNSFKYFGIDFSENIITNLAQKFPKYNFKCTTIQTLEDKFNIVLLLEVMEHIVPSKILGFLKDIKKNIDENGYLIISVPLYENLKAATNICSHCGSLMNKMGHVRIYTPDLVVAELNLAGYTVVYKKEYFFYSRGITGWIKRNTRNIIKRLLNPFHYQPLKAGGIILKCKKTGD